MFLDATIVNVALETIGRELPATFVARLEGLTYVNSAYFAVLAALLILAGALNDFYGRRRMFRIGLVGFGVASVGCGLAPTMEFLIAARIAPGRVRGPAGPGQPLDHHRRLRGRGARPGDRPVGIRHLGHLDPRAAARRLPGAGGELAGGVPRSTCRSSSIALWATPYVPESRDAEARGEFDWLGAAVIAVGRRRAGLRRHARRAGAAWQDPIAWSPSPSARWRRVAVPILMLTRPHPLVPPSLFASRNFTVVNLSTFLIYGALYVTFAFPALYLQGTLGYTPLGGGSGRAFRPRSC